MAAIDKRLLISDEMMEKAFDVFDKNEDGQVDLTEFADRVGMKSGLLQDEWD